MQLTDEDVEDFQNLYERKFGKRIDKRTAQAKAISLIRLMEIVYRPLTDEERRIAETLPTL
jgi:hypothetical protein